MQRSIFHNFRLCAVYLGDHQSLKRVPGHVLVPTSLFFLPRRFTLFTDGFPRVFLGKGLGYITARYSASVFFGHASPHINEKILAMPRDALGIILI